MLEIKNYTNKIIKEISFKLNENENLVILGKNGAGKSTLAKALCGLIENENVYLNNEKISTLSYENRAKLINYIPPKFEIFDEYITLEEYLELSSIKEIDKEKIIKIIKLLKLEKLMGKSCINFSSGEKQLLLLASSLVHNAKLTIFDELTANLDINRVKEVFDIFTSDLLNQKIIITHNLDLAYYLKYKILYLEDGKIEFFDSCENFFDEKNIVKFYGNSIKKVDNHLVVNL